MFKYFRVKGKGDFEVKDLLPQEDGRYILIADDYKSKKKPFIQLRGLTGFLVTKKQVETMTPIFTEDYEGES